MRIILIYIILIVILSFSCNYGQESVNYYLSSSNITSVSYQISPDSTYSIFIKLNDSETKKFWEITKKNIGKLLYIFKNNERIQSAVIKTEIRNGRIAINDLSTADELIKYIKILLE